jgi:hypothetical protein
MRNLVLLWMILVVSCHPKNKDRLVGTWQLIKKSNDHQVVFEYNPRIHPKKFIYWFKNDSVLITKDDDGGNMQMNRYLSTGDKITFFDSLHTNTFLFKRTGNKLSIKSIYSPFNLELKKLD